MIFWTTFDEIDWLWSRFSEWSRSRTHFSMFAFDPHGDFTTRNLPLAVFLNHPKVSKKKVFAYGTLCGNMATGCPPPLWNGLCNYYFSIDNGCKLFSKYITHSDSGGTVWVYFLYLLPKFRNTILSIFNIGNQNHVGRFPIFTDLRMFRRKTACTGNTTFLDLSIYVNMSTFEIKKIHQFENPSISPRMPPSIEILSFILKFRCPKCHSNCFWRPKKSAKIGK